MTGPRQKATSSPTPTSAPARVVWSYWEDVPGTTRAAYLDLCVDTLRRHAGNLEFRLVGRDEATHWLDDLDRDRWEALPAPNFRSDYLRTRLLTRYGGVWADPDTIAFGSLDRLLDALDDTGVVCWGAEYGRFFGGLCAAAPGAPLVEAWAAAQDRVLDRRGETLPYAALAQGVTWSLARELPWKALPIGVVAPIPWHQWRRFLSRLESPREVLRDEPITAVLWNVVMRRRLAAMPASRLLASKMLLGRLLRIALSRSTVDAEEDALTRLHRLAAVRYSTGVQRVEKRGRKALNELSARRSRA